MPSIKPGVNPSIELATCEQLTEEYQALMTVLENEMDDLISVGTDNDGIRAEVAIIRTQISNVRASIGFWRGEAAFWRNEIQENKTALKESNSLAKGS